MSEETGDEGIYKKLWKTKGIRYAAYHRLRLQSRWSVVTVSLLSFYIFALSIVAILFNDRFSPFTMQMFNAFSLISSVFIMIVSFIESLKAYDVKAEFLHKNANEISKIYNEFQRRFRNKTLDEAYSNATVTQYNNLLDSCPYNHSEVDYEKFQINEPKEFHLLGWGRFRFIVLYFKIKFLNYGPFLFVLLVLPLAFYLMLRFFGTAA